MQEILSKKKYEQIFQILKQQVEEHLGDRVDSETSAKEYDLAYLLGMFVAVSTLKPEMDKQELIEMVKIDEDEFEEEEEEEQISETELEINKSYESAILAFVEEAWDLIQEFISKLNKLLSRDDDFQFPDQETLGFEEEFNYAIFADGFVHIFIKLEELIAHKSEEEKEEILKFMYPMFVLANSNPDLQEEYDEDFPYEADEEELIEIIEDLEYIIAKIYLLTQE